MYVDSVAVSVQFLSVWLHRYVSSSNPSSSPFVRVFVRFGEVRNLRIEGRQAENETEEIASSPAAQLELLDRVQEHQTVAIDRELELSQRQLDRSSADLRRIDQEVDDASVRASELPVLQEKLKGLAEVAGSDADRINAAHTAKSQRAREQKVRELTIAALQKLVPAPWIRVF